MAGNHNAWNRAHEQRNEHVEVDGSEPPMPRAGDQVSGTACAISATSRLSRLPLSRGSALMSVLSFPNATPLASAA